MVEVLKAYAESKGVKVLPYSQVKEKWFSGTNLMDYYKNCDGFYYCADDFDFIFYDDSLSDRSQQAVLSHELGHALLTSFDSIYGKDEKNIRIADMKRNELMADMFACVLTALGTWSECQNNIKGA